MTKALAADRRINLDDPFGLAKPFWGGTVGFDHLMKPLQKVATSLDGGFPAYNISKKDDRYFVTLAVAGYREEHLSVETVGNDLWIKGAKVEDDESQEVYHKGLASRSFERKFVLADGVEVEAVTLAYGLLSIELSLPEKEDSGRVNHSIAVG